MAVEPISPEELRQGQAEQLRQLPSVPAPVNLQNAVELGHYISFEFRGKKYSIPPVSFEVGAQLQMVMNDLRNISDLNVGANNIYIMRKILRRATNIFYDQIVPHGWKPWQARFVKWLGIYPNPFKRASEGEVGALLGFFSRHRMTSTVHEL